MLMSMAVILVHWALSHLLVLDGDDDYDEEDNDDEDDEVDDDEEEDEEDGDDDEEDEDGDHSAVLVPISVYWTPPR